MYQLQINNTDFSDLNNDFFQGLCQFKSLANNDEFNKFCKWVIENCPKEGSSPSEKFTDYLKKSSIKTPWGGVYITKHQHPLVEKYLIIKQGGYLAFEKHAEKEEQIQVEEGTGILLKREGEKITVKPFRPGDKASFAPGDEHCIIAPENMIVFEKSQDHKGMDQDLIFIYTPE